MIDQQTRLRAETLVNEAVKDAQWLWFSYAIVALLFALLLLVGTSEYELLYQTFEAIAGEENEYWSPGLMAMTGAIMVTAFHLLATKSSDNPALRLIRRLTPWLIGLYLIGLGLLTAGVISLDASGVLLQEPTSIVIGGLPTTEPETHWLSALFENVTNPLALVLFSFGIGGVAIVNLFVAHGLIEGLEKTLQKIHHVKPEAARLSAEMKAFEKCEAQFRGLQNDLNDIHLWSPQRAKYETSLLLSGVISEATAKHKRYLKSRDLEPAPGPLILSDPVDPKLIERDLKKIEALDLKAITKILNTYTINED